MLSNREQLETYAAILLKKVEDRSHPSQDMLDRLERTLNLLQSTSDGT